MSLIRFLYYKKWSKDSYVFVGGDKNNTYECTYVENAIWHHQVKFSGLIIYLPVSLPHILLDLKDDDIKKDIGLTPSLEEQRLILEGDFPEIYNCFTPTDSQMEAREILSPDLMRVITDHETPQNIEFCGSILRLITSEKVKNNAQTQQALNNLAEDITQELNHKFKTYKGTDTNSRLDIQSAGTIKIRNHYVSSVWIAFDVFSIFVASFLIIPAFSVLRSNMLQGLLLIVGGVCLGFLNSWLFRLIYKNTTRY